MPLIVHNQPGPGGRTRKTKAPPPADHEALKLVGLILIVVIALGAVGWWFWAGRNEGPAVTVPDRPTAPAGRPPLPPPAARSSQGRASTAAPRGGLGVPTDQGAPPEIGSPTAPGIGQSGGSGDGAAPPGASQPSAPLGPNGRETGPE